MITHLLSLLLQTDLPLVEMPSADPATPWWEYAMKVLGTLLTYVVFHYFQKKGQQKSFADQLEEKVREQQLLKQLKDLDTNATHS